VQRAAVCQTSTEPRWWRLTKHCPILLQAGRRPWLRFPPRHSAIEQTTPRHTEGSPRPVYDERGDVDLQCLVTARIQPLCPPSPSTLALRYGAACCGRAWLAAAATGRVRWRCPASSLVLPTLTGIGLPPAAAGAFSAPSDGEDLRPRALSATPPGAHRNLARVGAFLHPHVGGGRGQSCGGRAKSGAAQRSRKHAPCDAPRPVFPDSTISCTAA
jgi:hypothetical protein